MDETKSTLKGEILDKMAALVVAAFGLVAALAWNDAIKLLFSQIFGIQDEIGPMIAYAIVVTMIAVILILLVARTASRAKSAFEGEVFICKLCKYKSKIEAKFIEHMIKEHAANPDKFLMK